MPWTTPTLREVRMMVRDDVTAAFSGAIKIGNGVLRVMSDAMAGLGHLTLRYIDWLSRQFLPDTAETEWLDRHGDIWLVNADNSVGRKSASYAAGIVTMTGVNGTVVPNGTQFEALGVAYISTTQITIGTVPTSVTVQALDAGIQGNLSPDETMALTSTVAGADTSATVVTMQGGADEETDNELRARVLLRIQQPPMGGDATDYIAWVEAVPGVTRAWSAPLEMGMGTITVRFMMDDLRASTGGFPNSADIVTVTAYLDTQRPVSIKDRWVLAPIPEPIDLIITELDNDTVSIRSAIEVSIRDMLRHRAAPAHAINGALYPAQTIYASWVSDAIMDVDGVISFKLTMDDHPMPHNGALGVLGTIIYG